ncbi:AMP-dependent synthetase/ligase [Halosolutus amylolyticus]|uniref:AMP-dependent synthetase/ligase n=1 Tax=Halosolutus amylolyticus TaxID=2932267 RepID=A0ABD5PKP0_9EURY|nr:long-chain fatty acid--CoA ligase [Halosolutus amylolyticus]
MERQHAERDFSSEVLGMEPIGRLFDATVERNATGTAQQYKGGVYDRSLAGTAFEPAPTGEYASLTYEEMGDIVRSLAAGFRSLGIDAGDRVGIFSDTRMEWAQSDFALLSAGAVVTTVYKSSSPDQARYLLDDPGASGVVVENEDLLERVLEVEDELDLEFIVSIDDPGDEYADREGVYTLAEVYEQGVAAYDPETYDEWLEAVDVDDLASIIYTSGTTGQPKGVKLTHRNFRTNVNQIYRRYGPRDDKPDDVPAIDSESRLVSYLPLAHVFERTCGHFMMFAAGSTVAYAESVDTLQEDFSLVGPTGATSVPRVYEKIYDAIREQASESPLKERIFEWATDVGRDYHRADNPGAILELKRTIADKLVFSQVKEALGGNVEFLVSGGGTLSADLCTLYHGMGLPIFEGYGLTETAPVVSTNPPENAKIGTIGPPVVDCEVAVDETVIPDSETIDTLGETGELLVKGPNVFEGYWEKPRATDEAFTDDVPGSDATGESEDSSSGRWFRTGDIVTIRPDDYMVFHERSKQLVVLSTGKNVAPAPIEDAFAAIDVVEQCLVVGNGEKFVGALIVPNFEPLRRLADEEGIDLPADPEAVCEHDWVGDRVEAAVAEVNERFEAHETIKEFRLVPVEFTEDNDMLTPTMKKKRRVILDAYEDQVADIYDEGETREKQTA